MASFSFFSILGLTVLLNALPTQLLECGYDATDLEGSIRSPIKYGSYERSALRCEWTITVPSVYKIAINFTELNIDGLQDGICSADWLRIESLTESGHRELHGILCGRNVEKNIGKITSVENQVRIQYYYRGYSNYRSSFFTLNYVAVPVPPLDVAKFLIENRELKSENLPKAVSALFLIDESYFESRNIKAENITNRLRIRVVEDLVRNFTHPLAAGEIAQHVSGLLAVCINPRNIYGIDMVYSLRKLVDDVTGIPNPYFYLILCNAGDKITDSDVEKLTAILENQKHENFWLDYQAMAVLALVCVRDRGLLYDVKNTLEKAAEEIKSYQLEDGGFGSLQTTSLVIQALSALEASQTGWKRHSAVNFIKKTKQSDGSFGSIQNLYAVAPVISDKTILYVNISKCNFSDDEMNETHKNKSNVIQLIYSVWIGDRVDVSNSVTLNAPTGAKFLYFMRLAEEQNEKFKFKLIKMKNASYVYEIGGVMNDPSSGRYWMLYTGTHVMNLEPYTKGLDNYVPQDGEMAVMWYKSVIVEH